jgi:RNA 2',3'-cyclic 3'-phosphodiesterase
MDDSLMQGGQESAFVRTFMAIAIPSGLQEEIGRLQVELKRSHADVAWARPDTMHLSLHFLGDIVSDKIGVLAGLLDDAAGDVEPFEFEAAGCGCFGNPRFPRVVWVGIRPCPPLMRLQKLLAGALGDLGLPVEARDYRPHLTVGRVRSRRGSADLVKLVASCSERRFGTVAVREIILFRSRLLPQGAEHTPLHKASLALCKGAASDSAGEEKN